MDEIIVNIALGALGGLGFYMGWIIGGLIHDIWERWGRRDK
jgi:hypothetical protein